MKKTVPRRRNKSNRLRAMLKNKHQKATKRVHGELRKKRNRKLGP